MNPTESTGTFQMDFQKIHPILALQSMAKSTANQQHKEIVSAMAPHSQTS
jgi:hypothetical protein